MPMLKKQIQRKSRHARIRARVHGTAERPRLLIFRSNQHLYAQLVDDTTGRVIAAVSDLKLKGKKTGVELARVVGVALAKEAIRRKISKAVFDRGGYKYHGQVAALAQGARETGLTF